MAFGRSMLFGNGLSALLTLLGISTALVLLFIVGPLLLAGGARTEGWLSWLIFFGALGAGFMLIEVAAAAAVRAAARSSGVFAHRHVVLAAPRHRDRCAIEPSLRR